MRSNPINSPRPLCGSVTAQNPSVVTLYRDKTSVASELLSRAVSDYRVGDVVVVRKSGVRATVSKVGRKYVYVDYDGNTFRYLPEDLF